jgi:glycerol transport system ATP-binding protein
MLELRDVSRRVGGIMHIAGVSLRLERGSLNVLLGPTLSGKTSLMRLMAGLDRPTSGSVLFDGRDVSGVPVARRNVAMVYQQFINYPAWTVRENIASPLRVRRAGEAEIEREVMRAAELLRLTPYLDRTPLELSGGQQQRVALARAIVKRADLVLLDEPLANLDYKLREELREELPKLFADSNSVVVYATTEPAEALLLGGATATLHQGRVTQLGPTLDVYRRPRDILTAKALSDPPLNTVADSEAGWSRSPPRTATIAFRAHHLRPGMGSPNALSFKVSVISTEITGSESFVHVTFNDHRWVMLTHGVHIYPAGADLDVHVEPDHLMAFDAVGLSLDPATREAA